MNQKDPKDINKAAAVSLVDDTSKRLFSTLQVGQGIVKLQNRWRESFLVQFPLVEVNKGLVTDDLLSRYLGGLVTLSGLKKAVSRKYGQERRFRVSDTILGTDECAFLHDI